MSSSGEPLYRLRCATPAQDGGQTDWEDSALSQRSEAKLDRNP